MLALTSGWWVALAAVAPCQVGTTTIGVDAQGLVAHPRASLTNGLAETVQRVACSADGTRALLVQATERGSSAATVVGVKDDQLVTVGTFVLPGPVRELVMSADRFAAVVEKKAGAALLFGSLLTRGRPEVRELPRMPAALVVQPASDTVFVAIGEELRSYRLNDGSTRSSWLIGAPIVALCLHRTEPWVVVATADRLSVFDLRDPVQRGRPVARATAELAEPLTWIGWAGSDSRRIVGGTNSNEVLRFFSAATLETLGQRPAVAPGAPLVAAAELVWLQRELEPRVQPLEALAIEGGAAPHWDSPLPAVTTTPLQPAAPPVQVAAQGPEQPPPAKEQVAAADKPPVESRPSALNPPPTAVLPIPSPPPPRVEAEPRHAAEAQPQPEAQLPVPRHDGVSIVGRATGQVELVAEVVALGPNNLLRAAARLQVMPRSDTIVFELSDLPAGRYRLQLMGPSGASLRTRPAFVDLVVDGGPAPVAEFVVIGRF